ncbi:MAG: hypothetical protein Q8930_01945 [Bacillota bacterium]|nr:hypothetical protein [Bacillota bacterium]
MRYIKIFIVGFLFIVIVQAGILTYLDKVYLADNATYSSVKVPDVVPSKTETSKPKLTIVQGGTDITASCDGKYISYMKGSVLNILDSDNAESITVPAEDGMTIAYYKWIYDRNRLILAERPVSSKKAAYYKFYYYDVDSRSTAEIYDEVNNKEVQIPEYNNEKISEIDMSTLTNLIYVKVTNSSAQSKIYRINIMAQENEVKTVTSHIGRIVSAKKTDKLFYQNSTSNEVFKQGSNSPVLIDGHTNLSLLGIDDKDNVYLALTNKGMTKEIYYGSVSGSKWNRVDIATAVDFSNVFVNFNGSIYIRDNGQSMVYELSTGNKTSFQGEIIGIYGSEIISKQGNEIIKTPF